jgi:hypothetical protein
VANFRNFTENPPPPPKKKKKKKKTEKSPQVLVVHPHLIGFLDFFFKNKNKLYCSQIWRNPVVTDCHFVGAT